MKKKVTIYAEGQRETTAAKKISTEKTNSDERDSSSSYGMNVTSIKIVYLREIGVLLMKKSYIGKCCYRLLKYFSSLWCYHQDRQKTIHWWAFKTDGKVASS